MCGSPVCFPICGAVVLSRAAVDKRDRELITELPHARSAEQLLGASWCRTQRFVAALPRKHSSSLILRQHPIGQERKPARRLAPRCGGVLQRVVARHVFALGFLIDWKNRDEARPAEGIVEASPSLCASIVQRFAMSRYRTKPYTRQVV